MNKFKGWFEKLSIGKKVVYSAIALVTATSIAGATSHHSPQKDITNYTQPITQAAPHAPLPKLEVKTVTEKQVVGFETKTINDENLFQGETAVRQEGQLGEKVLEYEIKYSDGTETSRRLLSENIAIQPIAKIIANGTKAAIPYGASALCSDGTYSFSQHRSGTCSHHGGVAQWL